MVVALAGGIVAVVRLTRPKPPSYQTEAVRRGALTVTVSATGTVQPRNVVQVGAEINGRVDRVLVDFNDRVKKGQVLARIDTDQLQARLQQARAHLVAARATVVQARATAAEADTLLARAKALVESGSAATQQQDTATAAAARARAAVATARANVTVARAEVDAAQTARAKATIRAPIDGIVLTRTVEPGQTVIAALQAPVLFVLAEDLDHMELDVQVDEADVGKVAPGQHATFTVDAWPATTFEATVEAVHNAPTTVQGVVTYEAVLAVANDRRLLRPGMTATATIVTDTRENALLVQSAALRFVPPGVTEDLEARREDRVYVLRDGAPARVPVKVGPSDGERTALEGDALKPGDEVVLDVVRAARKPARTPP